TARRTYARLAPLERVLDGLLTRRSLRLPRPRCASPATRLMWRQTSIHNALSHLDAYFDRHLYDRTRAAVLGTTGDPEWAEAAARPGTPPPDGAVRLLDRVPGPAGLARIADALSAVAPPLRAAPVAGGTTPAGTA